LIGDFARLTTFTKRNGIALSFLSAFLFSMVSACGQSGAPDQTGSWPRPAPIDRNGVMVLIRTSLIALQQADQTNNYSVLYALSAPDFQKRNSPAHLSELFTPLRAAKLDMSAVSVLEPQLSVLPEINAQGLMHMAGFFPSAPMQINFDLLFVPIENRWRMFGISVYVTPAVPLAPSTPNPALASSRSPTPSPAATAPAIQAPPQPTAKHKTTPHVEVRPSPSSSPGT
jgi:hypothetical protein